MNIDSEQNINFYPLIHKNPDLSNFIKEKTVFLDRDGVINQESKYYIKNIDEFKILKTTYPALSLLKEKKFRVIIISNQSGIGRGLIKMKDLEDIHNKMFKKISENGGEIERVYFCPHKPDDRCLCRKPKPGMFFKVKEDFNINFADTFYVGDRETDMLAGKNAGCKTAFINPDNKKINFTPNIEAINLLEAVKIIISKD